VATRGSQAALVVSVAYRPHRLHDGRRTYVETNCYADVLIELLHARGYEPLAAFGHLVRMDFEVDQWTLFKPPVGDLEELFGIDIHEMQPYRPLPVQIAEALEQDRTMTVEVDAWYLPDTAATSYRTEHVKTSLAADAIDIAGERLRYFHNAGLYELEGEDYRGVFRIGAFSEDVLPPYAELVRFDAGPALAGAELRDAAGAVLRRHLRLAPRDNPFLRFGAQLERSLPALLEGDLEDYHAYAFATVRMAGAGFELAASHVDWLLGAGAGDAVIAFGEIVDATKVLSFRLARRRPFDPEPLIGTMSRAWTRAMDALFEATP
jgi:hypothetical protein